MQAHYLGLNQSGPTSSIINSHPGIGEIDEKLSSGCYACYRCWLYVIILEGLFTLIRNGILVIQAPLLIIAAIGGAIEVAYAFIMMDAVNNKKLDKAVLGLKLAIASSGILLGILGLTGFLQVRQLGTEFIPHVILLVLLYGLYFGLVLVLPAAKIKAHLERREAFIQSTSPFNA